MPPLRPITGRCHRHTLSDCSTLSAVSSEHVQTLRPTTPFGRPQRTISWKIAKPEESPTPAERAFNVDDSQALFHILVVDDSDINRRLLQRMLANSRVMVSMATNGIEAVEIVLHNDVPLTIIFMDLVMPMLDGVQATIQLRAARVTTPIVAMTGATLAEDQERCNAAGMSAFLTKPFRKTDLLRVINALTPDLWNLYCPREKSLPGPT